MKSLPLLVLIIFISLKLYAQILEWSPYFVTIEDTITLTYDASKGNAGLAGASEVYMHTGVLTKNSSGPSDWKYVIADWNQNIAKAKMIPLGNNKWRARFHVRSFYRLSAGEKVTHLAFVFRNASGSRTGRTETGGDIFLPVVEAGQHLATISPPYKHNVKQLGDSLKILIISSEPVDYELYIDERLIKNIRDDSLKHMIVVNDLNKHYVDIKIDQNPGKTISFYFIADKPQTVAPLPDGIRDGINHGPGGDITLVLHAPFKDFIYVIGDWNGWEADHDFKMNQTPNGDKYWITLPISEPGTYRRYQYLVDSRCTIADPYTELVLDPEHDPYIKESTFPNLIPYPDKADGLVSVVSKKAQYLWQANDYVRPAKESLVIYELLLRDFLAAHDYKTLIDTLDYFVKLGVNAIELMPISEFEGNLSWGYNSSFYFAPDKYYGPKQDLQRFIDQAHKRDIAVIQDIVLNHSYGQSPLVQLYADDMSLNPWYNEVSPNPVYSWGYDFDHESPATQYFVDRVTEHWLTEYRMDGFRFDFTKGFTNRPGDGSGRDESRIAILKRMAETLWRVDPEAYVILEHFADNSEEKELAEYGMLIWGNSNYNYNEATMGWNDNSDFTWGSYKNRGWSVPHLVTYMESHDEERLMYKNVTYGNSSGTYNIKDLETALERIELAAAFFFTVPGPKMFWQFGEMGYDYSIDYNGRVGEKPIRWDYLEDPGRKKLVNVFSALINLKRKHATFSSPDYITSFGSAVKWMRINHDSMNAVLVGNFDVVDQTKNLFFPHTGQWYDYLTGDSLIVDSAREEIYLAPGEFLLWTDERLQAPLITRVGDTNVDPPGSFRLYQNFPNPFNPETTIRFDMERASFVSLDILNINGQKIRTLVDDYWDSGEHRLLWDGKNDADVDVANGVYLCRISAAQWGEVKKMILLR